jgi:hypothetical protein
MVHASERGPRNGALEADEQQDEPDAGTSSATTLGAPAVRSA